MYHALKDHLVGKNQDKIPLMFVETTLKHEEKEKNEFCKEGVTIS